jgi:hypothetical protein
MVTMRNVVGGEGSSPTVGGLLAVVDPALPGVIVTVPARRPADVSGPGFTSKNELFATACALGAHNRMRQLIFTHCARFKPVGGRHQTLDRMTQNTN